MCHKYANCIIFLLNRIIDTYKILFFFLFVSMNVAIRIVKPLKQLFHHIKSHKNRLDIPNIIKRHLRTSNSKLTVTTHNFRNNLIWLSEFVCKPDIYNK